MAGVARRRLDAELVRRKLARSREHAGQLIAAGRVTVGKTVATKAATQVETAAAIVVARTATPRLRVEGRPQAGGRAQGVRAAGLAVEGRRALDAGASTGGFTDVLLRAVPPMSSPSTSDTDSSPGLSEVMNASPSRTVRTYAS